MEDTLNYYLCASLLVACNNRQSAHPVYEWVIPFFNRFSIFIFTNRTNHWLTEWIHQSTLLDQLNTLHVSCQTLSTDCSDNTVISACGPQKELMNNDCFHTGSTNSGGAIGGGTRGGDGEPGWRGGSRGPRRGRWCQRPTWRRRSGSPRWSQSDRGERRSRGDEGTWWRQGGKGEAGGVESRDAGWLTPDQGGAGLTREPVRASGLPSHGGEEGARSHGEGRASEAESRETPTTAMLEDGSPAELAPRRWWAEEEQRGCQTT